MEPPYHAQVWEYPPWNYNLISQFSPSLFMCVSMVDNYWHMNWDVFHDSRPN